MNDETASLNLTGAVVVIPDGVSGPQMKTVTMLVEEVQKRTYVRWPVAFAWPAGNEPVAALGQVSDLSVFFRQSSRIGMRQRQQLASWRGFALAAGGPVRPTCRE